MSVGPTELHPEKTDQLGDGQSGYQESSTHKGLSPASHSPRLSVTELRGSWVALSERSDPRTPAQLRL